MTDAVGDIRSRFKGNKDAEGELVIVQTSISALQTRVFELQQAVLGLQKQIGETQQENMQLREKIGAKEERAAERQKYVRKQVGHSTVMVKEDEPGAFFCAACFDEGRFVPLQPLPQVMSIMGTHTCPTCKKGGALNLK